MINVPYTKRSFPIKNLCCLPLFVYHSKLEDRKVLKAWLCVVLFLNSLSFLGTFEFWLDWVLHEMQVLPGGVEKEVMWELHSFPKGKKGFLCESCWKADAVEKPLALYKFVFCLCTEPFQSPVYVFVWGDSQGTLMLRLPWEPIQSGLSCRQK